MINLNGAIKRTIAIFCACACIFIGGFSFRACSNTITANAMPFYGLNPQNIVLRARFYTSYPTSTEERKANIEHAAKRIDKTLVDVGGEFSFNKTVGSRTEERGYKRAKIIVDGEFVDGVGGGVCQVSTTLYNAALLAGLKITEYHPHSLPVSYIAPSFDAMVNSGYADLKFINVTDNPVIIRAFTEQSVLHVEIYGQPLVEKYSRQSVVTGEIPAPQAEVVEDEDGDFPDLFEGESRVLRYGKAGLKSEGYLVISKNGKPIGVKKIRTDCYAAVRGKVVLGKAVREIVPEERINLENFLPNVGVICSMREKKSLFLGKILKI